MPTRRNTDAGASPTPVLVERLIAAARLLQDRHGRIDVPWQDVLRLRRGTPGPRALRRRPDVLRAVYGRPGTDGRIVGVAGDSYILLVEWDAQGRVSLAQHPPLRQRHPG